jgi:hypothetical protein
MQVRPLGLINVRKKDFTPLFLLYHYMYSVLTTLAPQSYYQLIIIQMFKDDICIFLFLWSKAKTTASPRVSYMG